ncbi:MAG: hypothetical protein HYY06_24020 [Deltaproteobacteria bacterium]|nr:hypothetical protein [Deltaproteobacteria bacterium]
METATKPSVDIGPWVSEGWKMFTAHWGTWVKMSLIMMLPVLFPMVGYIIGYIGFIQAMMPRPTAYGVYAGPPEFPAWVFVVWGLSALGAIIGALITSYFQIGMWKAALKQARGGTPEMSDMKGNGHLYGRIFLANLAIGFLTFLGLLACYIGAFVVMGWYLYAIPLIIDRDLSIGEAMRQSKAATSQNLLMFILYAFLVGLISQVGAYACLVGLFVTMPLKFTIDAVAYRQTFDGVRAGAAPAFATAPSGPITY